MGTQGIRPGAEGMPEVQESLLEHSSQSNQDRLGGKHGKERRSTANAIQ